MALLAAGNDKPTYVAIYMMVMSAITVVAALFARETYQEDIGEPEVRQPTGRFVRKPAAEREPAGAA